MPHLVEDANLTELLQKYGSLKGIPGYSSWNGMKNRCLNPNSKDEDDYSKRGIKVELRWAIFKNFIYDMGVRPEGLSLERINNNGWYAKNNCKWATNSEQHTNTRHSKRVVCGESVYTIPDIVKVCKVSRWRAYLIVSASTFKCLLTTKGVSTCHI
jgi:hypothetical protein